MFEEQRDNQFFNADNPLQFEQNTLSTNLQSYLPSSQERKSQLIFRGELCNLGPNRDIVSINFSKSVTKTGQTLFTASICFRQYDQVCLDDYSLLKLIKKLSKSLSLIFDCRSKGDK